MELVTSQQMIIVSQVGTRLNGPNELTEALGIA